MRPSLKHCERFLLLSTVLLVKGSHCMVFISRYKSGTSHCERTQGAEGVTLLHSVLVIVVFFLSEEERHNEVCAMGVLSYFSIISVWDL